MTFGGFRGQETDKLTWGNGTRIVALAMFLQLTNLAAGDGFRNPPESASALGRIGGKIVHTEDASAATINPANMTAAQAPAVMASLTVGYGTKEFRSVDGQKEETEDPISYLPSLFGVWPLDGERWVVGLGITFPYGRFSKWDDEAVFSQTSPYFSSLTVINVNPSVALRVSDSLSAAVGVSLYESKLAFDYATSMGKASFEGDGNAVGANVAVTWRIADGHAVALTYRTPFDIDYDGDFKARALPPPALAAGATLRSDFASELRFPSIVQAGYGIDVSPSVRVELNVEWVEGSRNRQISTDIENNNILMEATVVPQDWEDYWTYGVGADWRFAENMVARAGYIYLETPSPTATIIPVAVEEAQSVISVGLGYDNNGHTLDLAYAVGLFDGLTVDDNGNPTLNGKYDFVSHLVSIAYAKQF